MKKTILIYLLFLLIISCNKEVEIIPPVPTVITAPITYVLNSITATGGGEVIGSRGSDITARGVCWSSTSEIPTLNDFTTNDNLGEEFGIGSFTSELTGLEVGKTYYVRAYADTNTVGVVYGEVVSFVVSVPFPHTKVPVEGGTFNMGSTEGDEQPVHQVTISSFFMSKYEITNAQYIIFMNAVNMNSDGTMNGIQYVNMASSDCQINYSNDEFEVENTKANLPVVEVSWYGAKAFSEYYGGKLPTEAEWEFAARGGVLSSNTLYAGGDTIDSVAWYYNNSDIVTHDVGTKIVNEIQLNDMTGNVMEWCADKYSNTYYSESPQDDPQGPSSGTFKVLRGGHFNNLSYHCRIANRFSSKPDYTSSSTGFRPIFHY